MSEKIMTQEEANNLIAMLKTSVISFLELPGRGGKSDFEVVEKSGKNKFQINIFRGTINREKVNYNALVKINDTVLLQLHLSASNKHINPITGIVITGSHWHVYTEGYGMAYAYPAYDITSKDFVENTVKFLNKFNVVDQPVITEQMEI